MDIEEIINKLNEMQDNYENYDYKYNKWNNWTLKERKKLLDLYLIISKKEHHIFDLIYRYHGCDSWEDIFRDYNLVYLKDKENGVKIAIEEISECINNKED
jgi:hypothetical protein